MRHRGGGFGLVCRGPASQQDPAGFESSVWFGIFAPAGTLPALLKRINAEINRA